MRLSRALLIAVCFPVMTAMAELDLSPQPEEFELDGIKIPQLAFQNGNLAKVSYQPPRDWKYSGSKDQLLLQPEQVSQASAKITKLPEAEVINFDNPGKEELRQEALRSLPDGYQHPEVSSEQVDAFQINGLHTYLVELKYTFFGEKFACYSMTVNRKPHSLNFRLICRERDYPDLRKAFEKSLYTWQNL
jgi:hypothetical protein